MSTPQIVEVSNIRPRQVLLVGLGGVGSRTVDSILSVMPDEYRPYTTAVAIDTDVGDLDKRLKNIPRENRISLGTNPKNGQSITVGNYIRNHPETEEWFLKGERVDLIEKRNTKEGAKQVRMVSRIALAATDEYCGMAKTLENILQGLNKADGTTINSGLLVMVVASVAGGTGAGTVLQFPLYLEQALARSFQDDSIQIECAMLLPNMFCHVHTPKNAASARANAYAVVRELISMNSRKLTRGDILPGCDFGKKAENISPYSRIYFFDDTSISGDTINPDLDRVYVPKTANALNEYLFGAAKGKITSDLDNTLQAVYESDGAAVFSALGTANLEYPKATYTQYAIGKWITKVIAKDWMYADEKVNNRYAAILKSAIENDSIKPDKTETKRKLFIDVIDNESSPFFKEIKRSYYISETGEDDLYIDPDTGEAVADDSEKISLAQAYWDSCTQYLINKVDTDQDLANQKIGLENNLNEADVGIFTDYLNEMSKFATALQSIGVQYEMDVIRPLEAENSDFYARNKDDKYLFTFLKKHKLHPIMLRYFLCELYTIAKENMALNSESVNLEGFKGLRKRACMDHASNEASAIMTRARTNIVATFAKYLVEDLKEYLTEIEDMFKCLVPVIETFEATARRSIDGLSYSNPQTGTVLSGGRLSMMYTWKQIEEAMSNGEDVYTVDEELNSKLHEVVYKAFFDQVSGGQAVKGVDLGENFRVRTKYETIMSRELQIYYSKLLNDRYSNYFPKDVFDAAKIECGLRNAYKDQLSRVDDPSKFTEDVFINRGSKPLNFATEEVAPAGMQDDARFLTALLNATVSNAKPYSGRLRGYEDVVTGESGDTDRIRTDVIVNSRLLRTEVDPHDLDEFGVAKTRKIEEYFIDGVSATNIMGTDVQTTYVDGGISVNQVKVVTSIAALQPFNFIAFQPSDDAKHDPTKGKTYFEAYREAVNDIPVKNNVITPHLHRNWHLADMLDDITDAHTDAYNRSAAEAFVLGFIFDVISVGSDCITEIGKLHDPYFSRIFGDIGTKQFALLDETTHASIDNSIELAGNETGSKRDTVNAVLVEIYKLLASTDDLRDAIFGYATEQFKEFAIKKQPQFISNCIEDENISNVTYNCILDVIDGYYQGTRQLPYKEASRSEKNMDFMFNAVFKNLFNMCKLFSDEISAVKTIYEKFVDKLYDDSFCEGVAIATETVTSDIDDEFMAIISSVTNNNGTQTKPFSQKATFSRQNAKEMFNSFIK